MYMVPSGERFESTETTDMESMSMPFLGTSPNAEAHSQLTLNAIGEILDRKTSVAQIMSKTVENLNHAFELRDSAPEEHIFNLFRVFNENRGEEASITKLIKVLKSFGLRESDPRLKLMMQKIKSIEDEDDDSRNFLLNKDTFKDCIHPSVQLISQALRNHLIIPSWGEFCSKIKEMFDDCYSETGGDVATYIPQLARQNPDQWGMSICTIDGQRVSFGDCDINFCVQSVSKAFNYAIVSSDLGADFVHSWVGHEPSGRLFNEICLDPNGKPHNPMINAGAIIVTSLIRNKLSMADRFDFVLEEYRKLAGGESVGFNNATFLSERDTADRNYALSYYMKENKCFPPGTQVLPEPVCHNNNNNNNNAPLASEPSDPTHPRTVSSGGESVGGEEGAGRQTAGAAACGGGGGACSVPLQQRSQDITFQGLREELDLYFQLCSLETNCDTAAVMAATLANGGVCPLTDELCIEPRPCRDVLSLMYSCGMYDYSGKFAFQVGLPAKSGVSGVMIVVVPNLMGIALFSPRLDKMGNSARGVAFCQKLIETFNFHNYDSLLHADSKKMDPRRRIGNRDTEMVVSLLFAAKNGDIEVIKRMMMQGCNMEIADYDGRTALHLAAAEGHLDIVRLLIEKARVNLTPRDRWNNTPIDEARTFRQEPVQMYLMDAYEKFAQLKQNIAGSLINGGSGSVSMAGSRLVSPMPPINNSEEMRTFTPSESGSATPMLQAEDEIGDVVAENGAEEVEKPELVELRNGIKKLSAHLEVDEEILNQSH